MKKQLIVSVICVFLGLFFFNFKVTPNLENTKKNMRESIGKSTRNPDFDNIPLYFIRNLGQADDQVRFYASASRYTLWLTGDAMVFDAFRPGNEKENDKVRTIRDISRISFLNARRAPRVSAEHPTAHRVNILKGKDRSKWKTGLATSSKVRYNDLYKNIDLLVYGVEKEIEYDWVVKPGGNHGDIEVGFDDAISTELDKSGNLSVKTKNGHWIHRQPIAFQEIGGKKLAVHASFKRLEKGKNVFGFDVGPYDKSYPLVIDPMVVAYSGFFGGNCWDVIYGIALDGSGAPIVCGSTCSSDFPAAAAYQGTLSGSDDAFIAKFTPDGTGLVFSTFFGGSSYEQADAVVLSGGNIYVGGRTVSSDFPTLNAYQSSYAGGVGSDAFIAKLSGDGSTLLYSSYFGGTDDDWINDIAVNGSGELYAAGWAWSSDLPMQNALYGTIDNGSATINGDAFAAKFSTAGNTLIYSTYLGGSDSEQANGIVLNAAGDAFITGYTHSSDFPVTANAYQGSKAGTSESDGFITRISADGSTLMYSTFLGGSNREIFRGIRLDASGSIYITGSTISSDYPTTTGAYMTAKPSRSYDFDAVVTKLTADGSSLVYSTYYGGATQHTEPSALALASDGSVYIAGYTYSPDLPMVGAFQDTFGSYQCGFISRISSDGSALLFSSYWGGGETMWISDIQLDSAGSIYLGGSTDGFWAFQAYQTAYGGGYSDGLLTKIVFDQYGQLTLTAPNGGENLETRTTYTVTWTAPSIINDINIDLTTDNGATWSSVAENIPNTGSYTWTVPQGWSSECKLSIYAPSVPGYYDSSDALFTISPPPIEIVAPNGGETLQAGDVYTILWNYFQPIDNVDIHYSVDNGTTWLTVAANIVNTGSYTWTVPNSPSEQCLVRVTQSGGTFTDASNAVFSIQTPPPTPMIPQSERDALIALYNSTNGDNWKYNTNWRKPGDPTQFNDRGTENTWYGITCNTENTAVIRVKLSNNSLAGTLPAELNNLTSLTYLDLYYNTISGSIPDLGNLTAVTYLNLSYNYLSGNIPASLSNMTAMTNISLYHNQLTGQLPDLSGMTGLMYFTVSQNQLSGSIPTWLNGLTQLRTLDIQYNQFSGQIPDLSNLTHLSYLNVYNNQLSGSIPASIDNLTELTTLNLGRNQFSGVVPDLSSLTKITSLYLYYNSLSGALPDLSTMTNLSYLYLGNNNFSGSIPNFNGLTKLRTISIPCASLSGSLPDFSHMTNLSYLYLNNNILSGDVSNLNGLTALRTLNLSYNSFSGFLPNFAGMTSLSYVYLNDNDFSGSIPASVGTATGLRYLYLDDNNLTGEIPDMSNLTALYTLKLSNNQLSGEIPAGIGGMTQLRYLYLDGNRLEGNVPVQMGNLTQLRYLHLNGNKLTGEIPASMSGLVNLYNSYGLKLAYNGLYTDNVSLASFLNTKHSGDWTSTQTIAPQNITVGTVDNHSVSLSWDQIDFNSVSGGYQVYASTTSGSGYELAQWISGKENTGCTVSDLAAGTVHYFVIKSYSNAHSNNANAVFSEYSTEISAETTGGGTVTVTSPNGGEILSIGSYNTITWTATATDPYVKIQYSTDNGTTWLPVTTTNNDGSYPWLIPSPTSGNCLIKISDTFEEKFEDVSDAVFTIQDSRSITITQPNGGETIEGNTVYTITTIKNGTFSDYGIIEYSLDGGVTWITITEWYVIGSNWSWNVPNTPSNNCLIRVKDKTGSVSDTSDAVFTIAEGKSVNVTSPSGGETFETFSYQTINWTTTGNIQNVKIEYSYNHGSSWLTVESSVPNTGTYNWTVTNVVSSANGAYIRITDAGGTLSDYNDVPFTVIQCARSLDVTVPAHDTVWQAGTTQTILWSSTGAINDVSIEYSTDSGSTYTMITPSTSNTGSYSWTVPNTPSTQCHIRVKDLASQVLSTNAFPFTITQ